MRQVVGVHIDEGVSVGVGAIEGVGVRLGSFRCMCRRGMRGGVRPNTPTYLTSPTSLLNSAT